MSPLPMARTKATARRPKPRTNETPVDFTVEKVHYSPGGTLKATSNVPGSAVDLSGEEHAAGREPPHKRRRISNDSADNHSAAVKTESEANSDSVVLASGVLYGQIAQLEGSTLNKLHVLQSSEAIVVHRVHSSTGGKLNIDVARDSGSRKGAVTFRLAEFPKQGEIRKHLYWVSVVGKRNGPENIAASECSLDVSSSCPFSFQLSFRLKWRVGLSAAANNLRYAENIFNAYFPVTPVVSYKTWTPQDFYESVHTPDHDIKVSRAVQSTEMATQLYPFQERAVNWILMREGVQFDSDGKLMPVNRPGVTPSFSPGKDGLEHECMVSHLMSQIEQGGHSAQDSLNGGILAEEMGLGKTVEIIATIVLHTRRIAQEDIIDPYTGATVTTSAATLIITPPTILEQWKNELETHAPNLRVLHYEGVKHSKLSNDELKEQLLDHDVVLTTYGVLSGEIHYAGTNPERDFRQEKKYAPRRTPLVEISWWRVCLDEAQMVESGVSNSAQVARLIPRQLAWAVSGTPLKKDVKDLLGLLIFLRYEPFCSPTVFNRLVTNYKDVFRSLFGTIALRHTKSSIRDELHIPPQKRIVVSMPFTAIEEQNYLHIFQQMCDDCGLERDGGPLHEDWNPNSPAIVEKMRSWLNRLRQTCLHAEIGLRNKRALGRGNGPLRTVEEVLEVLIEQNETSLRSEERGLLQAKVTRAHLLSFGKDRQGALDLYLEGLRESSVAVSECRAQLTAEQASVERTKVERKMESDGGEPSKSEEEDNASEEQSNRLSVYKQRLRAALEMEHVFAFFSATAYYQLKEALNASDSTGNTLQRLPGAENTELMAQDDVLTTGEEPAREVGLGVQQPESNVKTELSAEVQDLEKKEGAAYEAAKLIRKELLSEVTSKTTHLIRKVTATEEDTRTNISSIEFVETAGGIESRKFLDSIEDLSELLNAQTKQLRDWRSKYIQLLTVRLLDQDEDNEMTGEEYELSTKQQDEQYVCHEALRAAYADRHCMITGQVNELVNGEMKAALNLATNGSIHEPENKGPAPDMMKSMLSARALILQQLQKLSTRNNLPPKTFLSLRGIIAEMRSALTALEWQEGGRSNRATAEVMLLEQELKRLQSIATEQTKILQSLESELDLFRATMNQRLDFYRQLQQISDTVAPLQEEETGEVDHARVDTEQQKEHVHLEKLETFKTKRRFLKHLRAESSGDPEQRICVICQSSFEIGVLTVCGHQYCKECISLWWNSRGTCPTCKRHLKLRDFHQITYKPQALQAQEESSLPQLADTTPGGSTGGSDTSDHSKISIYSNLPIEQLNNIKSIDLHASASYGSKIDLLARHLLYLRTTDPGAKSIIFSQYRDFLGVLSQAFNTYKIGHASITDRGSSGARSAVKSRMIGIKRFREDPSVECFLLHAKADSSGLNLVNATHVFLCEPLLNAAIELQAIARVHRIGQRRPTTVWMYIVSGTVEEAIYEISVQRRLAHVQQTGRNERVGNGKKRSIKLDSFASTPLNRSRDATPAAGLEERTLDAANSLELQTAPLAQLLTSGQTGGEVVNKEDLWGCLFGKKRGTVNRTPETVEAMMARDETGAGAAELGRFLREEAATARNQEESAS